MSCRCSLVAGFVLACLAGPLHASDWPQFRGPGGSATSTEKHLPAEWAANKNVAWTAKVPGYGWSSPIAWGDKVFITTAITDKQTKPSGFGGFGGFGGFAGGGRGGRGGGRGGFGGFGGFFPQPGQIL